MKNSNLNKIIHELGAVLEIVPYTCNSESFLPLPKQELEKLLLAKMIINRDNKENFETLALAYIVLPRFIPLQEALIIARYEKSILQKNPDHKEDLFLKKEYPKIQKRVANEMKRVNNTIQKF